MEERSAEIIDLNNRRLGASGPPVVDVTKAADGSVRLRLDLTTSHQKALRVLAILAGPDE